MSRSGVSSPDKFLVCLVHGLCLYTYIKEQIVYQSKAIHARMCVSSYARLIFFSCNLDLDPMTLILDLDLGII